MERQALIRVRVRGPDHSHARFPRGHPARSPLQLAQPALLDELRKGLGLSVLMDVSELFGGAVEAVDRPAREPPCEAQAAWLDAHGPRQAHEIDLDDGNLHAGQLHVNDDKGWCDDKLLWTWNAMWLLLDAREHSHDYAEAARSCRSRNPCQQPALQSLLQSAWADEYRGRIERECSSPRK
eukprot:m51a1_g12909 hypothetical protein (181) ;mRNA; r:851-3868